MSPRRRLRIAQLLALAALASVAGCGGGGDDRERPLRGAHLTIYSSLPQEGPTAAVAADTLDAQQLALAQAGGRAGRYRVRLVALDATSPKTRRWDPGLISANARRAARDRTTVAYLGELVTGSSAISIPLSNEAGILQVSPYDGAIALTTRSAAVAGSPQRYYPRLDGVGRTFARVVPSDRGQAQALSEAMRAQGVARLALLTDEDPSGRALATLVAALAPAAGIRIVAREEVDVQAREHADLVGRVVASRADAALDATGSRPQAARLWRELVAVDPRLALYAPSSLATRAFVAGLGPATAAAHVTRPLLGPRDVSPAARRFARAFAARYGHAPAQEALYGYEAMRGVLAAIRRAQARADGRALTRAAVVEAYFALRTRDGVLGPYAIETSGDTTLWRWGLFHVAGGELQFVRALAQPSAARSASSSSG